MLPVDQNPWHVVVSWRQRFSSFSDSMLILLTHIACIAVINRGSQILIKLSGFLALVDGFLVEPPAVVVLDAVQELE